LFVPPFISPPVSGCSRLWCFVCLTGLHSRFFWRVCPHLQRDRLPPSPSLDLFSSISLRSLDPISRSVLFFCVCPFSDTRARPSYTCFSSLSLPKNAMRLSLFIPQFFFPPLLKSNLLFVVGTPAFLYRLPLIPSTAIFPLRFPFVPDDVFLRPFDPCQTGSFSAAHRPPLPCSSPTCLVPFAANVRSFLPLCFSSFWTSLLSSPTVWCTSVPHPFTQDELFPDPSAPDVQFRLQISTLYLYPPRFISFSYHPTPFPILLILPTVMLRVEPPQSSI